MPDFNRYETALTIVQRTLRRMGLTVPAFVYTGSDETALQMGELLNQVGRRLLTENDEGWQQLNKTWALSTVSPTVLYDLPSDYDAFIDSTFWNNTTRLPLIGPVSAQQWNMLKARALGASTLSLIYRLRGSQLEFYQVPSAMDLRIDYRSRGWVRLADGSTFRDYASNDDDTLLWDTELVCAGLKLAFMEAKGFDSTAAKRDYDNLLEVEIAADRDAPTLSASRGSQGEPLISPWFNLPDTGYGV